MATPYIHAVPPTKSTYMNPIIAAAAKRKYADAYDKALISNYADPPNVKANLVLYIMKQG